MKYKIKPYGITRDILGGREITLEMDGKSVAELRSRLLADHPALVDLKSLFIAVNHEYSAEDQLLDESDEIALIPPVSGG